MTVTIQTKKLDNPYVGPGPYLRPLPNQASHPFRGRNKETKALVDKLLAFRAVLFYAQSGAGKSSLINAGLISVLETKHHFEILPVCRVSSAQQNFPSNINIFTFNVMQYLDKEISEDQLAAIPSLSHFLLHLNPKETDHGTRFVYTESTDEPAYTPNNGQLEIPKRLLVIDQFEEIFTNHLEAYQQRQDLFIQLNEALQVDPFLYLLIAIREDYLGRLSPYTHLLEGLEARFYMEYMKEAEGKQAIGEPAREFGKPFTDDALQQLANNLQQFQIHSPEGKKQFEESEYIEPVQLQVVCHQLWEELRGNPEREITIEAITEIAKTALKQSNAPSQDSQEEELLATYIETALGGFYEQVVQKIIRNPELQISEDKLRTWFSRTLITEEHTRGLVLRRQNEAGGLPEPIVAELEEKYLIRTYNRSRSAWIELIHDRFVQPILDANTQWLKTQPLTLQLARNWESYDKQPQYLLGKTRLQEILKTNWQDLSPLVTEYVETSQEVWIEEEEKRKQEQIVREQQLRVELAEQNASRQKMLTRIALGLFGVAVLAAIFAGFSWKDANDSAATATVAQGQAQANSSLAQTREAEAVISRNEAIQQREISENNAAQAQQLIAQLKTSLPTATEMPERTTTQMPTANPTSNDGPLPTPTFDKTPTYLPTPPQLAELAFIPSGQFYLGRNYTQVHQTAFWIDKYEVSNHQFEIFVQETNYETTAEQGGFSWTWVDGSWQWLAGASWRFPQGLNAQNIEGKGDYPVVHVSWLDAVAFCEWKDKRLPTEREWVKAARGGNDARVYPWGDEFNPQNVNGCDISCFEESNQYDEFNDGYMLSAPVNSFPNGASPYGVFNMAGNVWEWIGENFYPTSNDDQLARLGGSSQNSEVGVQIDARSPWSKLGTDLVVGFRCAKDFRNLLLSTPWMQGEDVWAIQQRLFDLGYNEVGPIDGIFGVQTEQAVRNFQKDNGLFVDGIAGEITMTKLFEGINE